uniref:xanthine dehydrogenase family protein molybdopterin-binding subunit n=1 Tax=Streptomyces glaucescens TaxID=1907 RepID=UPI00117BF7F8
LHTHPGRVHLSDADTDHVHHHSGAFGSTGVLLTGQAVARACRALAHRMTAFAAASAGTAPGACRLDTDTVHCDGSSLPLTELHRRALPVDPARLRAEASTTAQQTQVSLAFCAQWFRVEVDPATGHVRILDSVHVADAGTVLDPGRCRAQIEGAVVQGIGTALREDLPTDGHGRIATTDLRSYLIPHFGETPATEVHLVHPHRSPAAPKPMSELPINPVAPALANAVRDATGIRLATLPLRPDTVWAALAAHAGRWRPDPPN